MLALVALLALPVDSAALAAGDAGGVFDPVAARAEHLGPGRPRELSKKEEWFRDKELRPDVHTTDDELRRAALDAKTAPRGRRAAVAAKDPVRFAGERIEPVTTLFNVWTHEALPILPGQSQMALAERFHPFLRDHYTNQATHMDTRLIDVLKRVAGRFAAKRIEVVSGYRSPKYNLMLRKKGPPGGAPQPAHGGQRRRLPHTRHRDARHPPLREIDAPRRRRLLPPLPIRPHRHRPHPLLDGQLERRPFRERRVSVFRGRRGR